jgi:hypothetical protein
MPPRRTRKKQKKESGGHGHIEIFWHSERLVGLRGRGWSDSTSFSPLPASIENIRWALAHLPKVWGLEGLVGA